MDLTTPLASSAHVQCCATLAWPQQDFEGGFSKEIPWIQIEVNNIPIIILVF